MEDCVCCGACLDADQSDVPGPGGATKYLPACDFEFGDIEPWRTTRKSFFSRRVEVSLGRVLLSYCWRFVREACRSAN